MYLVIDLLTLLDIVCKNTDEIYQGFGLDWINDFWNPQLVMDIILQISNEKIGLITDGDQQLFVGGSLTGEYFFNGDIILENYPIGQCNGEKSNVFFFYVNSLHLCSMFHYCFRRANQKWLKNPCDLSFPFVSSAEENRPEG